MSVIALGAMVLIGWALDIAILKSGLPGLVAMKVNTAIALILAGVSLWFSTEAPSDEAARFSAACAIGVGVIGVLTIGEFLTGWNLRIDEIFVTVRPTPLEPFGGRMAGNTALCLALLAVQLGRGGARLGRRWLDEACTLLVALFASVTLAGFAFGSVPITRIASEAQMAVHTAVALLVLSAGVLARDRDGPIMTIVTTHGPGRLLVRRLLPAMVGTLMVFVWLQLKGRQAGLFDPGFGLAAMAALTIVALCVATFWSAATLDKSGARVRWLTEAVKQNPAAIFMTGLDGTIEYVNTKFTETTGYTAAEALGRKPSLFKSGLTSPQYYADLWATILAGHPWRGEVQNRRKNGDLFWDAVMISPIRDDRGAVTHFLAVQRDITNQKRADAALRESEERYRLLFESNPHPMWVVDQGTYRFLAVNEAAVQHYGYSHDEFLAMTALDIRPPDDVARFKQTMTPTRQGIYLSGGWRHKKKDGTLIDVEVSAHDVVFGDRRAQLVLVTDVSERKHAEVALRESEERFRQMAETIKEAFFVIELPTWRPLYRSPTWAEIWGRPLSEGADAKIWLEAIHPEDRPAMRAAQEANVRGEATITTFRVRRPDGTFRWVRGRAYPVRDEEGRPYRVVGVAEDITELRRAEEQVTRAQKMEAVGRLAGGVAHDFNNLLTVILGNVELMQLESSSAVDDGESLREVKAAAERAVGLTRQLLAFSRRQIVEPTTFLLNDIVVDLLKMVQRLIGEDIEVVTHMAPDAGAVRADRGQIEQVLMNLAVNARDAMPNGGRLTIETQAVVLDEEYARLQDEVVPGDYAVLVVTDTGVGMSQDVKDRVFEPFFTTKEPGKGTGLGLATSYGIVKQSGGHLNVYSEPGLGTTMRVFLPSVLGRISQEVPASKAPLPRGSETILLVEDEVAVRGVATKVLRGQGYRVLVAEDGEEALRVAAAESTIDLLVTDVVMPRMGGRELAERIVAIRPDIRILFSTGYTDDAILQHRLKAHDVKVIQKPFTRDSLARKVREVLDAPGSS